MIVPSACNEAVPGEIAKVVLMPGDPLRAKFVAENYLDSPHLFNQIRNMYGYTGTYKGKPVSVMGSGMGIPSIALYASDLFEYYGVESIIRIGSAGGLADDIKLRDIVIAMSASTNSAFASQYDFPGTLAPTADYDLLSKAVRVGETMGSSIRVGSVFSSDTFTNARKDANERCRAMGMLAVEMETAGLYLLAAYHHKKALSILTISDHVFTFEGLSPEERQDSFHEMMEIALETACFPYRQSNAETA